MLDSYQESLKEVARLKCRYYYVSETNAIPT